MVIGSRSNNLCFNENFDLKKIKKYFFEDGKILSVKYEHVDLKQIDIDMLTAWICVIDNYVEYELIELKRVD